MRRIVTLALSLVTIAATAQEKQKRDRYEYSYDMPCYVEELKRELTYPLAWGNSGETDFNAWRDAARAKVLECMMTPPRRASSVEMEVLTEERRDGYTAKKIEINISAYSRVRAYLLVPDGEGPFPAINMLHDHGGHLFIGKEKMIRPIDEDTAVVNDAQRWVSGLYGNRFFGDYLAAKGYVVLAVDAPLWGERGREEGVDRNKYDIIAGNMMMLGRDLCAFMTYDDIAATDFLASLPETDSTRIGCVGFSMGAYRAWMLSALSDKIQAGAAVCWMVTTDTQLTKKYNHRENGGFANCIPALRQYLDYPHIASMACPKAMLFINGFHDKLFPADGVQDAFDTMRKAWDDCGADSALVTELWDMSHSCGTDVQDRVLLFLDEHLK